MLPNSTSANFGNCVITKPRLISTLVDTPATLEKIYSSPCSVQCWYCNYTFKDLPFPYPEPLRYFPRTRKIMPGGFYCSPNCVLAQIVYLNAGSKQGQQLEWFHQMMRDVYGMKDSFMIRPSPPQRFLKNKGGQISKQQLRKLINVLPSYSHEDQPFLGKISVIKEWVRGLEKGKEKQRQFDFAKQQMLAQLKEKKKSSTISLPSACMPAPAAVGKKRKTTHIPEMQSTQAGPYKVPTSLVLDSAQIDVETDRPSLVKQVMGLSSLGNQDWWNLSSTFEKFPERKEEIVHSIVTELDKEDEIQKRISHLEEQKSIKKEEIPSSEPASEFQDMEDENEHDTMDPMDPLEDVEEDS